MDDILLDIASNKNKKNPDFLKKVSNTKLNCFGLYSKDLKIYCDKYRYYKFDESILNQYYEINFIYIYNGIRNLTNLLDQISFIFSNYQYIDSWAITDSSYPLLKLPPQEEVIAVIKQLTSHQNSFVKRYGYLIMMKYKKEDISCFLPLFNNEEDYYVYMAEAWVLSELYIYHPEQIKTFIRESSLPYVCKSKTISKICDSYRVSKIAKQSLKQLRNTLK